MDCSSPSWRPGHIFKNSCALWALSTGLSHACPTGIDRNLTSRWFPLGSRPARFPLDGQEGLWQRQVTHKRATTRWRCYGSGTALTPRSVSFPLVPLLSAHGFLTSQLGSSVELSRVKVRLTSWSTWRLFYLPLYTALFWPLLMERAESFDFRILDSTPSC